MASNKNQGSKLARQHNRSGRQEDRTFYMYGGARYPCIVPRAGSVTVTIQAPNYHTALARYREHLAKS